MKDFLQAQEALVKAVRPIGGQTIPVSAAAGRVLMTELELEENQSVSLGTENAEALKAITPVHQSLLLASGIEEVKVKRQPEIMLLALEGEAGQALAYFLAARLKSVNAELRLTGGPLPPSRKVVMPLAEKSDLLVLVGGERDQVFGGLEPVHREKIFSRVDVQPGGGAFALQLEEQTILWMPDELLDAIVITELFLVPAVISMQQVVRNIDAIIKAELRADIRLQEGVTQLVPGVYSIKRGVPQVFPVREWKMLGWRAFLDANCLIVADPEQFILDRFSIVDIIPLDRRPQ